jgi:hypothetical protein
MTQRRRRLPHRRLCKTVSYEHHGNHFRLAAGYYSDGTVGEAFLNTGKTNSSLDVLSCDAAILISLALQFGCPLDELQHAVKRDGSGRASSSVGEALDRLGEMSWT